MSVSLKYFITVSITALRGTEEKLRQKKMLPKIYFWPWTRCFTIISTSFVNILSFLYVSMCVLLVSLKASLLILNLCLSVSFKSFIIVSITTLRGTKEKLPGKKTLPKIFGGL
jgi:hypothetical protein